jgi:O-antigen biosynthesis protein
MNIDRIAVISDYRLEYTTANYFRDVFEEHEIPFRMFLPGEQKRIPKEYNIYFYIDDGSHYIIYPNAEVLKVLYIIDTHGSLDWDRYLIRFADIVFCCHKNAVQLIKKWNSQSFWLPVACAIKVHYLAGCELKYDIGFIGNNSWSSRGDILSVLQKKYPRSYIGRADRNQIAEIYSSSKVVVNTAFNNDINMRFFEGLCSGALLLTDPIYNNGMEELKAHSAGQFFVQYEGIDDLCAKIDYYLENESERQTIAARGKSFADNQTYFHRWQTVYTRLKKTPKKSHSMVLYYFYIITFFFKRASSGLKQILKKWNLIFNR